MSEILVSSPGKVILFGEHAVVYNKTAIAASISLRTYARLSIISKKISLHLPDVGVEKNWDLKYFNEFTKNHEISNELEVDLKLKQEIQNYFIESKQLNSNQNSAICAFLYLLIKLLTVSKRPLVPLNLEIHSYLPIGAGLGSSASFSASMSAALLKLFDLASDLSAVNQYAFMAEKIIHGNPSGIDNTVCVYGGALSFRIGQPIDSIQNFKEMKFLLIDSCISRETKVQVQNVKAKLEKFPLVLNPIFDSIDGIAQTFKSLFETKCDFQCINELIDFNHHLLNLIGVGRTELDHIRSMTLKFGIHSKITGSGGGGCMLGYIAPEISNTAVHELIDQLKSEGFKAFLVEVGVPGIQTHVLTKENEFWKSPIAK